MEVITEITSQHYVVFAIVVIISTGIVSTIIFKNFKNYKQSQHYKKYNLNTDIGKIENTFNETLRHLDALERFMTQHLTELRIEQMELEIISMRGKIQHQLGHIPRMREYLK
ncbi:hypothetical protein AAA799E16_01655 [Marine Group I thaumarchaeote SCGC AAA799-E16]|uniref:Uncharacterized protein n=2 Tax=Marine Group I TaxID=905826 RepID=A0A087RXX2_9ARCH|nr:hypothetical protein AAA799E16_01655 [Marine Group I thaumarchaeote SCGC AAA799-E16]KFM18326.1 hypothetical protein SCCGRSA3_01245 [Marine Group I thaumarchaeote SCGC RSA3]